MESNETTEVVQPSQADVSKLLRDNDFRKMPMGSEEFTNAVSGKSFKNDSSESATEYSDEQGKASKSVNESKDSGNNEKKEKVSDGIQSRFKKLTEARDKAEQRAADLEARLAALESNANKNTTNNESSKNYSTDLANEFVFDKPEPDVADYRTVSEYTKAVAKYEYARSKAEDEFNSAKTKISDKRKDQYSNLMSKGSEIEARLGLQAGSFDIYIKDPEFKASQDAILTLLESDVGHEVAFDIASNSETRDKFAKMSTSEQLRFIGKLEAKFESLQPLSGKIGNKKTNALPIGTPVKGSSGKMTSVRHRPLNTITEVFNNQRDFQKALREDR